MKRASLKNDSVATTIASALGAAFRAAAVATVATLTLASHADDAIAQNTATPRQPNVIIILTDDQGYGDTDMHGNPHIKTPNINRIGKEGTEFTRFYVQPLCSPTRAALLTGRDTYRTGVTNTSKGGSLMRPEEVTIAEAMQQGGYRTGIFGKWHIGDSYPMRPMDNGFEESVVIKSGGIGQPPDRENSNFDPKLYRDGQAFKAKGYTTDIFFNEAIRFIDEPSDKPFFAYIPTNAPHTPLEVDEKYAAPFRKLGLDDRMAKYYGMLKVVDDNVGKLLNHLKAKGLERNTVVMFITDNGTTSIYNAGLRGRKWDTYEGGVRAISFIRWPGTLPAGRKIDRVAGAIDVMPTVMDLTGVSRPSGPPLSGVSLKPLLTGAVSAANWPDRTLYVGTAFQVRPNIYQNAGAISQKYAMISYPGTGQNMAFKADMQNPKLELYDLEKDPFQKTNIAAQQPDVLKRMQAGYLAWFNDATKGWKPGAFHIGNPKENPVTLARYQDAQHDEDSMPQGWDVVVERAGSYQIQINRTGLTGPGRFVVVWQGKTMSAPLAAGEDTKKFNLAAGEGRLKAWYELTGVGRIAIGGNQDAGNIVVSYLGPEEAVAEAPRQGGGGGE